MWFRLFLIAAMFCWVPSMGQAEERSGRSIIDEQYDRHSSENEYGEIKMTLIDRRGKESRREIRAYHLKQDDKSKILIQHLAPANIRGVGLLTWDQGEGREDDQWLYLPASKSIKRIAGGGKKEQFMGSDLAYEDLRVEDLDAHEYTLMGEEEISGRKCWKIESIPSTEDEKKTSGYGKRIMWVDQGHYFNLKVEFYDHNDRHIKTAVFEDIRQMKGLMYRPFKVTVNRISQKTATVLECRQVDVEANNEAIVFTQNYLKRPIR